MATLKIDFHTHTYHSFDSLMKPKKILKIAKERGLDGIVICDHNTIKGGIEAKNINKNKHFMVIVGAEIATSAGDITGIFLTKEIESRNVNDVIKEIKQQGGKVILNHPYVAHDLSKIDLSQIDFIEGYNARLDKETNQKAINLARDNNIPFLSGSDSHLYREIANCKTIVKDIESLEPVEHVYKPSKKIYRTISQYIKAFKKGNMKIFLSATAGQLKYSVKECLKLFVFNKSNC